MIDTQTVMVLAVILAVNGSFYWKLSSEIGALEERMAVLEERMVTLEEIFLKFRVTPIGDTRPTATAKF